MQRRTHKKYYFKRNVFFYFKSRFCLATGWRHTCRLNDTNVTHSLQFFFYLKLKKQCENTDIPPMTLIITLKNSVKVQKYP
jgi:hypothetical protein